jgi:hypothetical protein
MKTKRFLGLLPRVLLSGAAAGLLLVSCNVESNQYDDQEDSVLMTLQVNQGETRTTNEGNSTLWSDGDALSVIHTSAGGQSFWASRFDFQSGNMFQGSVSRLSATNDWYAVYPYVQENVAADQIHLTFPVRQTETGNDNKKHFCGEGFPLYGIQKGVSRSASLGMSMRNLLSGAELKFKNSTTGSLVVKEIVFTAPTAIAGPFQVDLTSETVAFTAEAGASKSVTLYVTDGEAIAVGSSAAFYAAFAAFDVPAGGILEVKVIAEDASGKTTTYLNTFTLQNGASFTSGNFKTVNSTLDAEHAQSQSSGVAGEVELETGAEPEDGDYLLVYENGESSMAFAPFAEYKSSNYAVPVSVVDGVVQPQAGLDLTVFAVTIENTGEKHVNDSQHYAYNVKNSEGQYIFYSSRGGEVDAALQIQDTNEVEIQGSTYKYYHTFVQESDGVQIMSAISNSSGNKYLLAYSSANGFYYEESNTGQKLHLYLLGGSAKEAQHPYFDPAGEVVYDWDAKGEGLLTNKPALKGVLSDVVTWKSDNTGVATVDQNGNVTVHAPGQAVITATAEANDYFKAGSAHYTVVSQSSTVQTWYKADEMIAGTQYMIVSNGYALQNNSGSVAAVAVEVSNEIILMNAPATLLWTATTGSELTNNSQYLRRSSSSSGSGSWGGNWGWGSSSSLSIGDKSSTASNNEWTYDADNNSLKSGDYSLYYSSSNGFSISNTTGTSSREAALYSTTKPLTKQTLTFDKASVRWTVGEGGDHALNQSYQLPQLVTGAHTTVTYTSENTSVATITGTTVTLKKTGNARIVATAKEENGYRSATASFTLYVSEKISGDFVDLGTFNLENDKVNQYLDQAYSQYTDSNTSTTIVSSYSSGASSTNRLDVPKPVTINWGAASSGTATITIFADKDMQEVVWTQTATSGSTSDKVYNLVPGKTYYCTVEDNSGALLKGAFTTEGRRRMMKVSDKANMNNANNCRDLGGMITADGKKRIKYGMIFRGTNLDGTKDQAISNYVSPNDSEQGLLANYMNVGYDIDLRAGGTSAFASKYSVVYVLGNMNANIDDVTNTSKAKTTIKGFFDAAKAGKASYFHCAIGSDRTGFWGLLVEGLLGCSVKECSIDYELTSFARNVTSGDRTRNSGLFNDGLNFFNKRTGETLQDKITTYLVNEVGVTQADIDTFKSIILEDVE